ncbi:hypothetical protein B0I35DRAFT_3174 [Stachybotrys elegans]|uniref:PAS domain-containing protein n=1 Tax=Stachybotrys elegans TaxID=80388 RepID=A0A8K0WVR5_9HYPO|nr:hypothetical protein B0I35DRAFT_3174 [Stachybotrys elegans]
MSQLPMEKTFISIHTLDADARILFASDSITDILGYRPRHVQNQSCFDYFHPDETPLARFVHSRGILLDKAAVLLYTRIRSSEGQWVGCECCFTVVHDVLVACTTIYRQGEKSERRALDAPHVRRLFSSSSQDPRYHMMSHLSPKFEMPPAKREPRAALILNRFTRSLSIMFSTEAASSILGLGPDDILGKSFYDCIQENCLSDAVKCLESAKANDSIAYLRFWFRDPRTEEDLQDDDSEEEEEEDEDDTTAHITGSRIPPVREGLRRRNSRHSDSDSGGAPLGSPMDVEGDVHIKVEEVESDQLGGSSAYPPSGVRSPGVTAAGPSRNHQRPSRPTPPRRARFPVEPVDLEAVVSCASDGLVVVLRRARQPIPSAHLPTPSTTYPGLFAAPWAQDSTLPQNHPTTLPTNHTAPPLHFPPVYGTLRSDTSQPVDHMMGSIRDIAVFAWGVVGANGNLVSYSNGRPVGEAQPFSGLPPWDSYIIHTPREQNEPGMAERNESHSQPTTTTSGLLTSTQGGASTPASHAWSGIHSGEAPQLQLPRSFQSTSTFHPTTLHHPNTLSSEQHHDQNPQASSAQNQAWQRTHQDENGLDPRTMFSQDQNHQGHDESRL